ncbi:MAG TPA: iron-containing alcohol dehydrogenase [Anaeromyxobacteraceae bacterium]|nr:iron-containing alcohol dehydrogenase [Anaeromyxobacteraceae bacterium]
MTSFELATATRILFGAGRLADAAAEVAALGVSRVLLATGRSGDRSGTLARSLEARGIAVVPFRVEGEPTVELARAGTERARAERCDGVVAIGGGSAIDGGKAVAALAANEGDVLDYLEVVGRGRPLARPSLPFVAVPTTAGTGSEVTRNAVLGSAQAGVKASLRSPLMLPRLAIVDPDLLAGAHPAQLAASGLDALAQLVEPYLSARANPVTDALAGEGMRRSARSLRRACLSGLDAGAREDLALASLMGGLCLANAGLGAVHGFAAAAGGMFSAPHGAVCAALLVASLEVNLRALRAREPGHPALDRFRHVAGWLTGRPDAAAEDGIAWIAGLVRDLGVPGLSRWGMGSADVPALVERAGRASSMRSNPIALLDEELREIAERSMGPAAR